MLYIVATPIGNLEDISLRALRILREVDLILCEDTRITSRLLSRHQIKAALSSYHAHSKEKQTRRIFDLLGQGKNVALVTDAGTPGVSDPGAKLINQLISSHPNVEIVCVPGPSALTAAASLSSFPTNRFLFLGFLPRKKGKKKLLASLAENKGTIIFYESPYRIKKTLLELQGILQDRKIEVFRELTKKFETVYRGSIQDVLAGLDNRVRGEIVVIIGPALRKKE